MPGATEPAARQCGINFRRIGAARLAETRDGTATMPCEEEGEALHLPLLQATVSQSLGRFEALKPRKVMSPELPDNWITVSAPAWLIRRTGLS